MTGAPDSGALDGAQVKARPFDTFSETGNESGKSVCLSQGLGNLTGMIEYVV